MKKIELIGYGSIQIEGLKFKDQDGINVDSDNKPLKYVVEGRGTTKYVREDGSECPRNEVCKRLDIDGEEVVVPKLKPTTRIDNDVIAFVDESEHDKCELNAIDKAWYLVNDAGKLKSDIDAGKVMEFPLVTGSGHKLWKAVVKKRPLPDGRTAHMLYAIRGNIDNAIMSAMDSPVEFEIPMASDQKDNIKKIFKSIGA